MFGLEFFDSDNRHIHIPVEPLQAFFSLVVYVFFACYYAHLQRFSISSCPLNTAIRPFSKGFSSGFFYLFSVWQAFPSLFQAFLLYYMVACARKNSVQRGLPMFFAIFLCYRDRLPRKIGFGCVKREETFLFDCRLEHMAL